ncbi:MAG: 23S rRNA (guanosine(2251)-2'-O)-methyltransferase RlmB [Atopobiaceae bacterium]|nr:23S rRNA (guanosine(2251)-2'-O)-methyltransferase RlmB [Atopobiaceae bacterium]
MAQRSSAGPARGRSGGRNQARNSQRNGLRGSGRDGTREARPARGPQGGRPAQGSPSNRGQSGRAGQMTRGGQGSGSANIIEGRRAVAEAIAAGIPIAKAFVQKLGTAKDAKRDDAVEEILVDLADLGVEIEEVPGAVLNAMSNRGAHQGIAIRVREYRYASIHDVIRKAGVGDALVIVLDHVTDEGNFGAIVRSAEVVGAAGVVIAKNRAASVGIGAYKTSAGAVLHIPIAQVPGIPSALDELKEAGFWVVGATEHATESAWEAPLEGRITLVMGSEGDGISRLALEKCDITCALPQRGRVESLNVAQAATVLAYEWARRTWGPDAEGAMDVADDGGSRIDFDDEGYSIDYDGYEAGFDFEDGPDGE